MTYVCTVCDEIFTSDKKIGKIEEEWSNPVLCPICNSDEIRESSSRENLMYQEGKNKII